MKILVVEDDLFDQKWIEHLLLEIDDQIDVILANDTASAIDQLETKAIDCLLVDLYLPGLSGSWIVRHMRSVQSYENVPVFLISGDSGGNAEAVRLGADGFLDKNSLTAEKLRHDVLSRFIVDQI